MSKAVLSPDDYHSKMMRREPSYQADDIVIWICSSLLALVLGAGAAYAVAVAADGASVVGSASFKEILALIAAGVGLIVVALQARLVRFFMLAFAIVFFIALAVATHGFTAV
ncbi:MAG: hypothetical protein NVS9B12_08960 [Vulcanimicrobiaceae bacterium]